MSQNQQATSPLDVPCQKHLVNVPQEQMLQLTCNHGLVTSRQVAHLAKVRQRIQEKLTIMFDPFKLASVDVAVYQCNVFIRT